MMNEANRDVLTRIDDELSRVDTQQKKLSSILCGFLRLKWLYHEGIFYSRKINNKFTARSFAQVGSFKAPLSCRKGLKVLKKRDIIYI